MRAALSAIVRPSLRSCPRVKVLLDGQDHGGTNPGGTDPLNGTNDRSPLCACKQWLIGFMATNSGSYASRILSTATAHLRAVFAAAGGTVGR